MNKPITLCDRCDIAASCLLNYDGVPCRKNRTVEPTNADRIRARTDEELAFMMAQISCPDGLTPTHEQCMLGKIAGDLFPCEKCWLEWLRQEATT